MESNLHVTSQMDSTETYDTVALGNTIRLLREHLNLTQAELGKLSSISPAQICKLEKGIEKRKIPLSTLVNLAPHLNVSLDYLLSSCITTSRNDYERFFDYEGKELDLYRISKKIYSVDSELLILLSSYDFLSDKESITFTKKWIKLKLAINKINNTSESFTLLFNSFKDYCLKFMETLHNSIIKESF